jgi:hypothetical protein
MKRAAAVLAVAAVAAAVVIATHNAGGGSAQAALARAAARTVAAGSSRFTIKGTDFEAEGLMDYVHGRGRISYGRDGEVLLDGDVAYVSWPMPWRPRRTWLRFEDGMGKPDPANVEERAPRDPKGLLESLKSAGHVRDVGAEDVRSTATVHYEGTLELPQVAGTTVRFGVWLDGDGVARRIRLDEEGGESLTIEYYEFGAPVLVTRPAPSDVISDEELAREMGKDAGDSTCSADGGDSVARSVGPSGTVVICAGVATNLGASP